jgi:formylglycine-generating enzyme required for sulfatase activity
VRDDVLAATGGNQRPYVSASITGKPFYLVPAEHPTAAATQIPMPAPASPTPIPMPTPASPTPTRSSEATEAWAAAKDTSDPAVLEAFISHFKDTFYADLARSRLKQLKDTKVAVASPPASPSSVRSSASCDGIEIKVGQNERRCFRPGAGKTEFFKDCPTCPEMVVVPAGTFTMGSPANEPERSFGEAQVPVSIALPFAVGRFAVTFDEWDACVADDGCNRYKPAEAGWDRGKQPVINVNWDDAATYAAWVSRKTGKIYRLLSEAEREYVTRAGTTTPFWWGSSITTQQANYDGTFTYAGGSKGEQRKRTTLVDSFEPNPWGLYNVHGNVWEWTEDCWYYKIKNHGDGRASTTGSCISRVVRGGSWDDFPKYLRSASRKSGLHSSRDKKYGFRLARTLDP